MCVGEGAMRRVRRQQRRRPTRCAGGGGGVRLKSHGALIWTKLPIRARRISHRTIQPLQKSSIPIGIISNRDPNTRKQGHTWRHDGRGRGITTNKPSLRFIISGSNPQQDLFNRLQSRCTAGTHTITANGSGAHILAGSRIHQSTALRLRDNRQSCNNRHTSTRARSTRVHCG